MASYEAVIGLEVHAQLLTKSKLFCTAAVENDSQEMNSHVDVVSAGLPGALPLLNERAVELAVRAGLACHCEINPRSRFERKHYFYADLPKGYQITQLSEAICKGGYVEIGEIGKKRRIRLDRIQLEEDAGQLFHVAKSTLVNLNRAGTALIEIVSAPDLRTPAEAKEYLKRLHSLLVHAEVSDGNLEAGNFRCDANVSVRRVGDPELGTRAEVKNVNSFRNAELAIEYEISRQIAVIESGDKVVQETRDWDAAGQKTFSMRLKEDADDYRYFPDPDQPLLKLSQEEIARIKREMPESPDDKAMRLKDEWGLSEYDVGQLISNRAVFDAVSTLIENGIDAPTAASWVITDLMGELKRRGVVDVEEFRMPIVTLASIIKLVSSGTISRSIGKSLLGEAIDDESFDPAKYVKQKGLEQISDDSQLQAWIDEAIQENPSQLEEYRGGKEKLFAFFVGQIMKKSSGKANPQLVSDLLKEKLG